MPTQYFYRSWCVPCGDWTLFHHSIGEEGAKCKTCNTSHATIKLKDIPDDKLLEQRERYKKQKKEKLNNLLGGGYLFSRRGTIGKGMMGQLDEMMSEDYPEPVIIEADAGQKSLDEIEKRKRNIEITKRNIQRAKNYEEALKYKDLGRNDICLCGSEKKYKKCCMNKMKARL